MNKHFTKQKAERVHWGIADPVGEWLSWIETATIKHYIPIP